MTGEQIITLSQYSEVKMLKNSNFFYNEIDKIRILQLTDLHLFKKEEFLHGVNTNKNLENLIKNIINNKNINYDLIFLTGDISQDMTEDSYIFCSKVIAQLEHPVFWIPGNHDDYEKANKTFKNDKLFSNNKFLKTKYWDFIFVDTCIEGKDEGYIDQKEISFIDSYIKQSNEEKYICIIMHHHPIPVNTPLIDDVILKNGSEFLEKTRSYPTVKLIISGHVHGDYSISYGQLKIETSPATCFQWLKGTHKIEIENYAGYVIYEMGKNYFKKQVLKAD